MSVDDEAFAELLGEDGILRSDVELTPPDPAFIVFAQRPDARLEPSTLRANAERFFGTTVGLTVPKRYNYAWPMLDAARIVVAPSAIAGGVRLCFGRPTDEHDLFRADEADLRAGRNGMYDLARRCKTTWHVARTSDDDRTALLLAAVISTTFLGPIFDGDRLFAVRTARVMLETAGSPPYR
ncbi:hypothetical protein BH09MYX1_BH09MYX1_19450 [soil metagenome]